MNTIEELLSEEVRKYEHLYNPSLASYKDAQMASNSWREISSNVGLPVDGCLKMWRKLRDKYVREKKGMQSRSGDAGGKKVSPFYVSYRGWAYRNTMQRRQTKCEKVNSPPPHRGQKGT